MLITLPAVAAGRPCRVPDPSSSSEGEREKPASDNADQKTHQPGGWKCYLRTSMRSSTEREEISAVRLLAPSPARGPGSSLPVARWHPFWQWPRKSRALEEELKWRKWTH